MTIAGWFVFLGGLLITMVLLGTFLRRTPLTAAILYLVLGALLGPAALGVLRPDPTDHALAMRLLTEVALLIALFAVGMDLGVPLRGRRWWVPLRLATISMLVMVAMVAAIGVYGLGLPLGAALILGGILAPTDPVLAAGLPSEPGPHPDRLAFSLAAEGGLNDGTAFPVVMLGLGLLGLHDLGPGMWRWWVIDVLWSTVGGLAIGALLGAGIGRLVVYSRGRHGEALGSDEFLSLGLIAMAFGVAESVTASGFLSVLAAGLALRRVAEHPVAGSQALPSAVEPSGHPYDTLAAHSHHASGTMLRSVQVFNTQIEKIAELTVILVLGAMAWYAPILPATWWFVPLVLLILRPISALSAFPGARLNRAQMRMIGWFGIRGVGSLFYLLLVLSVGVDDPTAEILISLTVWTVVASIIVHGLTGQPLIKRYIRQQSPSKCSGQARPS